jgi:hypothetical protein
MTSNALISCSSLYIDEYFLTSYGLRLPGDSLSSSALALYTCRYLAYYLFESLEKLPCRLNEYSSPNLFDPLKRDE